MHRATRLKAIVIRAAVLFCALFAVSPVAQAAELAVEDIIVDYVTQTSTSASGTVTFDVAFSGLGSDTGNYDLVAVQVMISRTLKGTGDVFSLSSLTNNTAAIGPAYWLDPLGVPTGNELSNTVGDEFYFGDFVSPSEAVTPSSGAVIARFVVDFDVDAPSEFGTYHIERGDASQNKFVADLLFPSPNTITPASFQIERLPEPTTVILLATGFGVLMLRRRRA